MQKWQIDGNIQWLCDECAKDNAHIFLLLPHAWLGREANTEVACDCCRCREALVQRLGWARWLLYPLLLMLPRPSLSAAKKQHSS